MDKNQLAFDGFDYSIIGSDQHVDDLVAQAENQGILRREYIAVLMRDLRGLRYGNRHNSN